MSNGLIGNPSSPMEREAKSKPGIFQNFGMSELGGLLGALGLYRAYDDLGDLGRTGMRAGEELANLQLGQTQFRPYTVTTATGGQFGMMRDPTTGAMTYQMAMSPQEQQFQQAMFGGAGQFYQQAAQDPAVREQQIYEQIQAATAPQQMAERLGLEERLAAQGRLGVRTAQFGGTPEQLAMERAQQQTLAQARLSAAQQARQEQAGLAALGQQYLMGSYMPQQQMLAALAPGQTASAQQQQAQLYGAGLFGEARASGLDALLGAGLGRANIVGAASTGLLSGAFGLGD